MGAHLINGEFQSDKYPTTPRGKVPLSVKDTTAQDLLWTYADRHEFVDQEFSDDLRQALRAAGYQPPEHDPRPLWLTEAEVRKILVDARKDTLGFDPGDGCTLVEQDQAKAIIDRLSHAQSPSAPQMTEDEMRSAVRLCADRFFGIALTMSQERDFAKAILTLIQSKAQAPRGEDHTQALKDVIVTEDDVLNEVRLARIAAIIEAVDTRCMAVDGPVAPTLEVMAQEEISAIYALARGKPESWRP